MSSAEKPGSAVRVRLAVALGLAGLTALVFLRAVGLPFIGFDDPDYVTGNLHVSEGLTARSLAWALSATHAGNWHPVTWLSHLVDASLYGLAPAGHHATNVLLHCVNAALLFLLLERMTGARWRSALAAALFALHPLRVESVAWVAERKDVLSGLLWLATTLAYVAWVRVREPRRYALVVALYALGLAAKPMLVTLPFTLLLLDAWPLGRFTPGPGALRRGWPLLREKLPLLALSAASCAVTFVVQRGAGAVKPFEQMPIAARLANAATSLVAYVAKTVWPASLAVFYPYPGSPSPAPAVVASVAALAAATVLAWRARRRWPFATVGWLWFAGTLVPVVGLVQVGAQAMADRYTYVPGIGLALIAAWAVPAPSRPRSRAAWLGVAAAVLAALSALTVRQIGFWETERRLFQHALEVTGPNWLAETVLGMNLEREGDVAGAIARYRRAIALEPRAPEALNNLGNALLGQGDAAGGVALLRRAVELWPDYVGARSNLGAALCAMGQLEEGTAHLSRAVERSPGYAPARYNLGLALAQLGRKREALEQFEAYLQLAPGAPDGLAQIERLRGAAGR